MNPSSNQQPPYQNQDQSQGYPAAPQPGIPPVAPADYASQPNYGTPQPQVQAAPPPKSNPNSTQNTLQIAEIRDGVVIMNDGSFRTVVMAKSINFDLMSPEEREAVEFSYQNFLNSLYFEVQIFVRSSKVEIRPYLEKLDKIRSEHDNMLLAVLMEDYLDYIAALAEQTNIMDKKFYVVIPFYQNLDTRKVAQASKGFMNTIFGNKETKVVIDESTLENAKNELKNRVGAVLSGLTQCGVQGVPLDTQELIELYYDSYNPDTATRQPLKNFNDMTAPVVTKGQGFAAQPKLDKEIQ